MINVGNKRGIPIRFGAVSVVDVSLKWHRQLKENESLFNGPVKDNRTFQFLDLYSTN